MNDINISSKNTSSRRTYPRRNRKKNITDALITPIIDSLPLTTTILTTTANSTLLVNSSSVPINDLFASVSYFTQHKYIFIIGLFLLIFLCIISIVFIIILKCTRGTNSETRRPKKSDKKHPTQYRDFLDDQKDHEGESVILLDTYHQANHSPNHNVSHGTMAADDISNTFSIDPMLEKKIIEHNPPNSFSLSPKADDTSLDTLRGSLISSPPEHVPISQQHSVPLNTTTTDSPMNPEEPALAAEKDDDLRDLDLKRITPRFTKATNSTGNLSAHRSSASSIEQTIRGQERRKEEKERGLLHGSNSNLYEKEYKKKDEREKAARKEHNSSQVSLTSRTSEDSCY